MKKIVGLTFVFAVLCLPSSLSAKPNVQRMDDNRVLSLADNFRNKEANNLYNANTGIQDEVYERAGMVKIEQLTAIKETATKIEEQKIKDTFLRAMKEYSDIYTKEYGGEDKERARDLSRQESAFTEGATQMEAYVKKLQNADGLSADDPKVKKLNTFIDAAKLSARIVKTMQTYDEITKKNENAIKSSATNSDKLDLSVSVMKEMLGAMKEYGDFVKSNTAADLAKVTDGMGNAIIGNGANSLSEATKKMADLGKKLDGVQQANLFITETLNTVSTLDEARQAITKIQEMNVDKRVLAMRSDDFVPEEAANMAEFVYAAAEGIKAIGKLAGKDPAFGTMAEQAIKTGAQGLEMIGDSVTLGANIKRQFQQGDHIADDGAYESTLKEFADYNLMVRRNEDNNTLIIPNGYEEPSIVPAQEQDNFRRAVSAFASLTGRNPTQKELAALAGGYPVDVGRTSLMDMAELSIPERQVEYDEIGGRNVAENAFINRAIANMPQEQLRTMNPTTGQMEPYTMAQLREEARDLGNLYRELFDRDLPPEVFARNLEPGSTLFSELSELNNRMDDRDPEAMREWQSRIAEIERREAAVERRNAALGNVPDANRTDMEEHHENQNSLTRDMEDTARGDAEFNEMMDEQDQQINAEESADIGLLETVLADDDLRELFGLAPDETASDTEEPDTAEPDSPEKEDEAIESPENPEKNDEEITPERPDEDIAEPDSETDESPEPDKHDETINPDKEDEVIPAPDEIDTPVPDPIKTTPSKSESKKPSEITAEQIETLKVELEKTQLQIAQKRSSIEKKTAEGTKAAEANAISNGLSKIAEVKQSLNYTPAAAAWTVDAINRSPNKDKLSAQMNTYKTYMEQQVAKKETLVKQFLRGEIEHHEYARASDQLNKAAYAELKSLPIGDLTGVGMRFGDTAQQLSDMVQQLMNVASSTRSEINKLEGSLRQELSKDNKDVYNLDRLLKDLKKELEKAEKKMKQQKELEEEEEENLESEEDDFFSSADRANVNRGRGFRSSRKPSVDGRSVHMQEAPKAESPEPFIH